MPHASNKIQDLGPALWNRHGWHDFNLQDFNPQFLILMVTVLLVQWWWNLSGDYKMDHMNHMNHMAHADHGAHGHDVADDSGCVFSHAMTFHAGVCQEILFPGWRSTSALQILGSALVFLLAGILYEGLKYYREALHSRAYPAAADSQLNIAKSECGASGVCAQTAVIKYSMWSRGHLLQTLLHVVQSSSSYVLMLVFMTYNVWLCAALVLGLGLGYFFFGWKKNTVVDVTEHCQ